MSSRLVASLGLSMVLGCARAVPREDLAWRALVAGHGRDEVVDGLSLHAVELGDGPPVVLVHGIADSTYSWRANAAALVAAGHRVVMVDQPGFGLSDAPPGAPDGWSYSVEAQGEAVLGLVDRLGLNRFALVGHSLGGAVSLYLAWRHPDRIERVAVVSPASERVRCRFGPGLDAVAAVTGMRWLVGRALASTYAEPERVTDVEVDEYARLLQRPGRAGRGVLGAVCRGFFSPTFDAMAAGYGELTPPLLVLWGQRDAWHPSAMGERLHAAVPGSRLELVAHAGHDLHQERSDVVNPLLVGFLAVRSSGDAPALTPERP